MFITKEVIKGKIQTRLQDSAKGTIADFPAMVPLSVKKTRLLTISFIHREAPASDFADATDHDKAFRIDFPNHPFQPGQSPFGDGAKHLTKYRQLIAQQPFENVPPLAVSFFCNPFGECVFFAHTCTSASALTASPYSRSETERQFADAIINLDIFTLCLK